MSQTTTRLSASLLEDIDALLNKPRYHAYTVGGKPVAGMNFSSLCDALRIGDAPSGRIWRTLGSDFHYELRQAGYRIEPGQPTQKGQRASREVVFKA